MKLLRVRSLLCPAVCLALFSVVDPASAAPIEIRSCGTTISAPGDYLLAQDIGPCPGAGIVVAASMVNLRLGGRTITGVASVGTCTSQPQIGVEIRPGTNLVGVTDGRITGFTHGMSIGGSEHSLLGVRLLDNCALGLSVQGHTHTFSLLQVRGSDVGVRLSIAPSLLAFTGFVFSEVAGNRGNGIEVVGSEAADIENNLVFDNGGAGIAFLGGTGNIAIGNFIMNNGAGITVNGVGNLVLGNRVGGNTVAGIAVAPGASDNRLSENTARGNGIDLAENNACDVNIWELNDFAVSVGCVDRPLPQP